MKIKVTSKTHQECWKNGVLVLEEETSEPFNSVAGLFPIHMLKIIENAGQEWFEKPVTKIEITFEFPCAEADQ